MSSRLLGGLLLTQVGTRHNPPDELHSPFYPARGAYSSTDPAILRSHFEEIASTAQAGGAAAGDVVVALSWWGQGSQASTADTQGVQTDDRVAAALEAAEAAGVTVAWHLEPYPGRSAESVSRGARVGRGRGTPRRLGGIVCRLAVGLSDGSAPRLLRLLWRGYLVRQRTPSFAFARLLLVRPLPPFRRQVAGDVEYLERTYGHYRGVARLGRGRHPVYFAYDR